MPAKQIQINLNNRIFDLKIVKNPRQKNINLSLKNAGEIRVSGNRLLSEKAIFKLIEKHQVWIEKQNEILKAKAKVQNPVFTDGSKIIFAGQNESLNIQFSEKKRSQLIFQENKGFLANLNQNLTKKQIHLEISNLLEKYYKKNLLNHCKKILQNFQQIEHKTINQIRIKKMTSRWGSCSSQHNLNFNLALAKLPVEVQNYIIAHEYAHLFEMNHSIKFWKKVAIFEPNYLQARNWLKKNSHQFL